MSKSGFKQELFAEFTRIGRALGNGHRLDILEFLAQGPRSVDALARACGLSVANTSHHLQQLRAAGLVRGEKKGQHVCYSLADDDAIELMRILRAVGERSLAEVERLITSYLHLKDELEPIPARELLIRAREGLVTVLDVRPPEEYAAGHLPGAINIPLAELESRLDALDPAHGIVAYCRGPHCVLAYEAVAQLRRHGRKARRLEHGFPEWKIDGMPIEHE